MNTEIEIKLAIAPSAIHKLLKSRFICSLPTSAVEKILQNTYYDTDDWQLHSQKIALRVRKSDRQYIQTLKTQGSSEQGMHQRLEWEWDLSSDQLDFSLLPSDHWPAGIDTNTIKQQFTTNFTRQLWYIQHIDRQGAQSLVEMVLDQGQVATVHSAETIEISELELELVNGKPMALTEIAAELMEQCAELEPSDISKAARGFALLNRARG